MTERGIGPKGCELTRWSDEEKGQLTGQGPNLVRLTLKAEQVDIQVWLGIYYLSNCLHMTENESRSYGRGIKRPLDSHTEMQFAISHIFPPEMWPYNL